MRAHYNVHLHQVQPPAYASRAELEKEGSICAHGAGGRFLYLGGSPVSAWGAGGCAGDGE